MIAAAAMTATVDQPEAAVDESTGSAKGPREDANVIDDSSDGKEGDINLNSV